MAETKKTILFEVQTQSEDAIKKIIEYQAKIEELRKTESKYKQEVKEGNREHQQDLIKVQNQIKAYQSEIGKQNRMVQNTMRSESELYKDTLDGLRAKLSVQKDELRYMEQGSAEYQKQLELIKQTNDEVKAQEEAYGVFVRNVGNYSSALSGLAGTVRNFSKASMLAFAVMGEAGEESEEAQKRMSNLQKAMMALILVQNISTKATKSDTIAQIANNIAKSVGVNTAQRVAKAEAAAAAMKKADTIATKGVTAATWLWNAALSANPIFLIITAIAAVIAGIALLGRALGRNASEQKRLNEEIQKYQELQKENEVLDAENALKSLRRREAITKKYAEEIETMRKNGATAEQIAKRKEAMEEELRVESEKRLEDEIRNTKRSIALKAEELRMQNLLLSKMKEGSKKYKEQKEKVAELASALNSLNQELTNKEIEQSNNRIEQAEKETKARSAAGKTAYDKQKEHLDNLQKVESAHLAIKKKYLYDYTKSAEENAKRETEWNKQVSLAELELNQKQKKERLDLDRKFLILTEEQYKAELEVLRSEYQAFIQEMQDMTKREQATLLDNAIKLAGGEIAEKQLSMIEKKYYDAEQAIKKDTQLSEEEKSYYILKLKEREAEEIKGIAEKTEKEIRDKAMSALDEYYKNDYRLYSNNSIAKTQAEIEQIEKRIEALKEAGLSSYEEESKLQQKRIALIGLQSQRELLLRTNSIKEQFDLRRKALEDEQALYEVGSLEWVEIEREKTELLREELNARAEAMAEWTDNALSLASQFADMMNAFSQRELEKVQADNEAKAASLDKQLKAGLISQKQYDKQKEKLDKELAEKELKIKRKKAIQEKALNIAQTVMNTAVGLVKTFANLGYPLAIPFMALGAAMGAMQLATIVAEPLPKAREGMIIGASHESGGVIIEAEGGERIVAKEPSRAFPELLSLISYVGKNMGVPDTGYASRILESGADNQSLADAIGNVVADRMQDLQVVVSVEAIDNAKAIQTKIENASRL